MWSPIPLIYPDPDQGFGNAEITDLAKRIDFKMQHKGVRSATRVLDIIPLPALDNDTVTLSSVKPLSGTVHPLSKPLSLIVLGQYLSGLRWHHYDQQPLPKYFYPSAGSLYPVRLYLRVGANTVTGLAAGRYYYHPDHHLLHVGHDDLPAKQLILQLHGCLDAITPLYGDKAMPFCQLEAGYMLNVLNSTGLPLGLTSETDVPVVKRKQHKRTTY